MGRHFSSPPGSAHLSLARPPSEPAERPFEHELTPGCCALGARPPIKTCPQGPPFADAAGRAFPGEAASAALGLDEAWVANGHGHSLTVVAGLGGGPGGTSSGAGAGAGWARGKLPAALTRRDRGWYHYLVNATGIAFNSAAGAGRAAGRDAFGYFATCQADANTYGGRKEPNFFMGPSLYDSDPGRAQNLVSLFIFFFWGGEIFVITPLVIAAPSGENKTKIS